MKINHTYEFIDNRLITVFKCEQFSITLKVIYLNWWPIFRDGFSYIITILILFAVISDGQVYW